MNIPTAANKTVSSNVIGIRAGKGKFGFPPIFIGQSWVNTQPMQASAVVVPVIP